MTHTEEEKINKELDIYNLLKPISKLGTNNLFVLKYENNNIISVGDRDKTVKQFAKLLIDNDEFREIILDSVEEFLDKFASILADKIKKL